MSKFKESVIVFWVWLISGAMFIMGGSLLDDSDAPLGSTLLALAIGSVLLYAGKKLHKKYRLSFKIYLVVAIFVFLSTLGPSNLTVGTFVFGTIASFAFVAQGVWFYKKGAINSTTVSITPQTNLNLPPINTGLPPARQHIQRLIHLQTVFKNPLLSDQISYLRTSGHQILDFIDANPNQAHKADTFKEYYLPKAVQLLEKYAELSQKTIKSENIQEAMHKITTSLNNIEKVFAHCLNSLYSDITQDIDMDLDVLEQMMDLDGVDFKD